MVRLGHRDGGQSEDIQELLRTTWMESCKSVKWPMTAEDCKDDDSQKTDFQRRELTVVAAKLCRRGNALCVYISQDRGDITQVADRLGLGERSREPKVSQWWSSNIGADVNRWWRSALAKRWSTVPCAVRPGGVPARGR